MDTNFVLAGKYEGSVIKTDNSEKVYVEHGFGYTSQWYFDKTNVVNIEKINEESSSYKSQIAFWLGSVAAAGASDVKDVILKITWRDNAESMIKIREGIYTKILATSMSDVSGALHLKNDEERRHSESRQHIENELNSIKAKFFEAMRLSLSNNIDDILNMVEMLTQIHSAITDNVIISHYLFATCTRSSEESRKQMQFTDIEKKCADILKDFDGLNDRMAAEKYIKYQSINSIDYSIDGVSKIVAIYHELGDFRDCKKMLTDIGDCSDPANVEKYIKYRKLADKLSAPTSRGEFEAARQALESMGDYLHAQLLSDKKDCQEYADSYFAAFSKESDPTQTVTAPGEKNNGGCYVATCVYGSYDCPQVWILRRYRDNTLSTTWYGRAFIRTYYTISPAIVKWFGNTVWFKKMWRGTLDRMVKKLESNGVENTPYEDKNW